MIHHAVILAIGSAQNHSKLTYNRSHAMLPALGKPLFIRIMERLYRIGIRQYTVIIGESDGALASYLNSQWMPDVKINLIIRFGTDSLTRIVQKIAQEQETPFVMCSYNSFTHNHFPEGLIKKHDENPQALIFSGAPTSLSHASQQVYAVVEDRQVLSIVEAPSAEYTTLTLNDMFICGYDMLDYLRQVEIPSNVVDRSRQFVDIAHQFIQAGGTGLVARSNWILQVEADRDLLTLNKLLLDEGQDAHILSELPYTVKIIPPVRIDPQVSVGQGAKIGPHVYLERGCSVGHNVVLKNSIVLTRAAVPSEKTLVNTILTTRGPIT